MEAQEFGQNDPRLLASMKTLAALYRVQERFAESEPLLRLAVEREEADGRDHPELPNDLDLLARVCMAQMKLGDAEASFKREVSLLERKYGADSMEIVPALNSLGRVIPSRH